ncbi:NAD(P)/FAD-dependent oxidoreductase [Prauserella halophila]|uniref:NAD(P)/FAD-dependent oxidoreductase n=1 Tax=Prauserella halophila TaxID=185641 RepID=A0ABP4GIV2_9PSEU|nr:NAD(P)/FAD-dependent oxidoreductase [Prauserella halophila]MCP2237409.1 putative flavoprotein CzcO associated with the cation diffusion facilitator CzcD [Prauserella halophila]
MNRTVTDPDTVPETRDVPDPDGGLLDTVVVGAGFAGMYALHRMLDSGRTAVALEAGHGVGGVWYWNRYPGARCDVESVDYSYSFDETLQQDWVWSERYATQPEIRRYCEYVADRFGLRPHLRFGRRVDRAHFDDRDAVWTIGTEDGERYRARHVVLATGSLSAPNLPDLPGRDSFEGEVLMTAQWPAEGVDLTGNRVGVIGTGSSGIQAIPLIAEAAESLTVFQRSANYTVPVLNHEFTDDDWERLQAGYPDRRAASWRSGAGSPHTAYPKDFWEIDEQEREAAFAARWAEGGVLFGKTFDRQTVDPEINRAARDFAERKIREIVRDPQTAADLTPTDHPIGTKRICTDRGYYETFNADHVSLVNLRRDPIVEVTPWGVKTEEGIHELDVLVYATGFDAMTGALTRIDIVGPRGDRLADTWSGGPLTYLGVGIPGFPNLFALNGPGSPSVLINMVLAAEQQVDWVMELLDHCDAHGHTRVEARHDAAETWTTHVDELSRTTLFPEAPSWYMGANIEGKKRVFMPYIGGFKGYIDKCAECRDNDYAGFVLGS